MSTNGAGAHVALLNLGKTLYKPTLVVHFDPPPAGTPTQHSSGAVRLGEQFLEGETISVKLPFEWTLQSAYVTAFEDEALTRSITEQIYVHRDF
jgi:hypothetical protein